MKKTFRKALAALLAVLMVAFSVPFTALATVDGVTCWWDGTTPITSEPEYVGYQEIMGLTDDELPYGTSLDDLESLGLEPILENYKPTLSIIVSSLGDATKALTNQYYSYSATKDYATVKAAGYIIDPSNLKAGQRIAVTFEIGGVDCMSSGQIKASYNNEYLSPHAYTLGKWNVAVSKTAWIVKGDSKYGDGAWAGGTSSVVNEGDFYYPMLQGAATEPGMTFIGGTRPFGDFGLNIGTIAFEVLQDCALQDVINFDDPALDASHRSTFFTPVNAEFQGTRARFMADCKEAENEPYCAGLLAINWVDASPRSTTTDYTVTFNDADGNEISSATYASGTAAADITVPALPAADFDSTNHYSYKWDKEIADVTADATYTVVKTATAHTIPTTGTVTAPATCTTAGTTEYKCTGCDYKVIDTAAPAALDHSYTGDVVSNSDGTHKVYCVRADECGAYETVDCTYGDVIVDTPATFDAPGAGHKVCSVCGYSVDVVIDQLTCDHEGYETRTENAKEATCTEEGYTGDVYCTNCDALITKGTTIDALDHNFVDYTYNNDATCLADGTETATCTRCDETDTRTAAGTKLEHAYTELVSEKVEPDCTTAGKEAVYKCVNGCDQTIGGEEIVALGHDFTVVKEVVAPTVQDKGYTVYGCSRCDATEIRDEVPALGVNITVAAETAVPVTINGAAVAAGETVNVPYGSDVVLAADVAADAEFVGWNANGTKVVATEATATVKAIADVTYQPIVKAASDTITVVFYDMFQNVIDTQTVNDASEIVAPTAPVFTGYTFTGWDVDLATITEDTVVNAVYEANTEPLYTVTAEGCTITVDGQEVDGTGLAYNTLVTVTSETATAWEINGATVAYGPSYSFYVGSNVTVVPVTNAVDPTPVVAAVSTTKTDSCNVVFLATRALDGGRYVNAGFVYGKNLADSDLVLEKVGKTGSNADSGKVKAYYCATDALQFSLTYGVTAQTGTASARAFLAYIDANGDLQVTYGAVQSYNYDTAIAK